MWPFKRKKLDLTEFFTQKNIKEKDISQVKYHWGGRTAEVDLKNGNSYFIFSDMSYMACESYKFEPCGPNGPGYPDEI